MLSCIRHGQAANSVAFTVNDCFQSVTHFEELSQKLISRLYEVGTRVLSLSFSRLKQCNFSLLHMNHCIDSRLPRNRFSFKALAIFYTRWVTSLLRIFFCAATFKAGLLCSRGWFSWVGHPATYPCTHPWYGIPLFRHPLFRRLCLLCILAKYTHYNISFINRALISNRFPTCPSSSKLLERLVSKQLLRYLKDNDLLPDLQSAYRGHHPTETAVLKILSDILSALDTGNIAMLPLLDLSAAFDSVDRNTLLQRLRK